MVISSTSNVFVHDYGDCTNGDGNQYPNQYGDKHANQYGDGDEYVYPYQHVDAIKHAYTNQYVYANAHIYGDGDEHIYANQHVYADEYIHANQHIHPNAEPICIQGCRCWCIVHLGRHAQWHLGYMGIQP
ncbi:MAG: hypothetical protein RI985_561 [Chloroflexota bacterium]